MTRCTPAWLTVLSAATLSCVTACAAFPERQSAETAPPTSANDDAPVIAGYGVGTFEVGELLYETDFSDADQ